MNSLFEYKVAAAAASLQSCPTLCDPIDGSPPGSPVPGILQARTLEWVAISFSMKVKSLSRVWLLATSWTAACQAPPSMGFSRQEHWSGCHLLLSDTRCTVYYFSSSLNKQEHPSLSSLPPHMLVLSSLFLIFSFSTEHEQGRKKSFSLRKIHNYLLVMMFCSLEAFSCESEGSSHLLHCRGDTEQFLHWGMTPDAVCYGEALCSWQQGRDRDGELRTGHTIYGYTSGRTPCPGGTYFPFLWEQQE